MKSFQREPLLYDQIANIKNQLKNMLNASEIEYKKKDMTSFQQACEKLYKVMLHILELKSGYNIRYHEQLYDSFYWKKAGFHLNIMTTFTSNMNLLHSYFYEGGVYPSESVDRTYNN